MGKMLMYVKVDLERAEFYLLLRVNQLNIMHNMSAVAEGASMRLCTSK